MSTGIGLRDIADLEPPRLPALTPPSDQDLTAAEVTGRRIQQLGGYDATPLLGDAPSDGQPDTVTVSRPSIQRYGAAPQLGGTDPLGLGLLEQQQPRRNVVPVTAPTINFAPIPKSDPLHLGTLPNEQEQRLGLAGTITLAHPEVAPDPQRVRDIIAYILAQPDPQAALRSIVEPAFDPFTRGADFINKYVTEPLAKFTDKTPIFGLAGGGLGGIGGYHGRTAGDNPATKFAYGSVPYVAADLLTGNALMPAYLANAGLQVTAISDRYNAGEISAQDALKQAAANVAPFMLGPLLHGLGVGAQGLAQFHDSPAGQAFVRRLQASGRKFNEAGEKFGMQNIPTDESGNPIPMSDIIKGERGRPSRQTPETPAAAARRSGLTDEDQASIRANTIRRGAERLQESLSSGTAGVTARSVGLQDSIGYRVEAAPNGVSLVFEDGTRVTHATVEEASAWLHDNLGTWEQRLQFKLDHGLDREGTTASYRKLSGEAAGGEQLPHDFDYYESRYQSASGEREPFPGEQPEQARFTPEGDITSERLLQGDRGQQGDLMGAPAQTGEGLTTESAGPMFERPAEAPQRVTLSSAIEDNHPTRSPAVAAAFEGSRIREVQGVEPSPQRPQGFDGYEITNAHGEAHTVTAGRVEIINGSPEWLTRLQSGETVAFDPAMTPRDGKLTIMPGEEAPAQTGEGLTTESAGPMFAHPLAQEISAAERKVAALDMRLDELPPDHPSAARLNARAEEAQREVERLRALQDTATQQNVTAMPTGELIAQVRQQDAGIQDQIQRRVPGVQPRDQSPLQEELRRRFSDGDPEAEQYYRDQMTPQEPAGVPPAPEVAPASIGAADQAPASNGAERAPVPEVGSGHLPKDTNDPYFEQAPPHWSEVPDRPSVALEQRRQQIEQELQANPMTPHTGAVRRVHRFREDTRAAAARGGKRRGQMVDQIAVSDSTYQKIKQAKDAAGLPFRGERNKQGGWWVDYEDELYGLDNQMETDHSPSVAQLKRAIELKAELKDVTREIRAGAPDEQLTSADAAHMLRDQYHLLYHDVLNNAADEETAQMFGDVAQAYEDTMAAVNAGDRNMPASARRVMHLPERAKIDLNAGTATTPTRAASPATEYARDTAADGGVAAPPDQGGEAPEAARGAGPAAAAPEQPAAGLAPPSEPPPPPTATGGTSGNGGERPPTIPEIEARSKPLTVEERARIGRDTSETFFEPSTTGDVTATAIKSDMDAYQRIQNLVQRVPGLRSVGTYVESVGAARGQERLGNPIPLAMVKRDITIGRQSSAARAGILGWAGKVREVLGLDPNGIARDVQLREGASVPKKIARRLDDIIEHPEDYNLTPEQEAALVPVQHTLNASTQHALDAGVDVHEIGGPYFPRTITKGPKGEKTSGGGSGGSRLASKPGFAKSRVFEDTRSAVAAGYQVATPLEALGDRLISGVKATANKEAYKEILALGEKPSDRIPQATKEALPAAREAYKAARRSGDARAIELAGNELDAAKRELRKAGLKAATPTMGEAKAYGRIFPKPVMDELAKYGDVSGPGVVDEFFAIQRANETTGDHSSLFVQGGNLAYRNPVAWLKATAYSTASFAREPWGWVSRNLPAIEAAVKDGAAQPPSEFLLQSGGRFSQRLHSGDFAGPVGRVVTTPLRGAQRMFEWMTFIGQVEWHKGAVRMDMTPAARQELGATIRKGMGSSSMPGVTNAMRNFDKRLWYAGGFMRSTLGLMVDASRAGARGAEARKTLGMVVGGATALTIALQYAVDRTMPNLTDPNDKNKRWGYVEFPGGGVNLYGPLFPYIRLIGKAGQDVKRGDYGAAAGEGESLVSGKFALPIRTAIDLRRGTTYTGEKIAPGWRGTLDYLAKQSEPLGIKQATEGGIEGVKSFPARALETTGLRTTPNSPYQLANRALIEHGVAEGMNASPADKAKAREQFPDVAKLIDAYDQSTIDKGTTGGQIKEARGNAGAAQAAADAALESGQMSVSQWKDARKSVNDVLSGNIWQITKGQPYTSGDKVLDGYYAIFHDFQKAGGAIIDKQGLEDALDQYTAGLSAKDQQHLDENTGVSKTTPKVAEYRAVVKQLADSGFFDQEKQAYTSKKYSSLLAAAKTPLAPNGLMPEKFPSLSAMKASYIAAYVKKHTESDPLAAAADGGREFERISAVKQLRSGLQDYRETYYKSHPELLRLATQWGFNTLSKAEEKILTEAGR